MKADELYQKIGEDLATENGVIASQMFGKPCLKHNNKAFAAFFKGHMVFKLGKENMAELKTKYPASVNWDPSGKNRPMKDWLQVSFEYHDDWKDLAIRAMDFVN